MEEEKTAVEAVVEAEKTFTQAQIDEVLTKRLERERKKYEDYDSLKTKLTEYEKESEEKKRAQMSEVEKFKTDLEKEQSAKQTLEQELAQAREVVKQERMRNTFLAAATQAGISYLDDAWVLADKSGLTVEEDGKVVGVDAVIQSLITDKPFLVGQTKPKEIGSPTPHNNEASKALEEQLKEAKKQRDLNKVAELSNKLKGFK